MRAPWWIDHVTRLLAPGGVSSLGLGALWHLRERLQFVHDNVEPALLELDLRANAGASDTWAAFGVRELEVRAALALVGGALATQLRTGQLSAAVFREGWQSLGYLRNTDGAGTPADDYLDGLLNLSSLDAFVAPFPYALLNLATRASRLADFLGITEPGVTDVVFDLGSGSGKLALTVAASTRCKVRGVELEPTYAAASQRSSERLGLRNLDFHAADVRDVDLSVGNIFYLYYPFHGPVAREVAQRLGALARQKDITVYAAGPELQYGEYFLTEVANGALKLKGKRGEFGEVLLMQSLR
jgi:hypothetical protein